MTVNLPGPLYERLARRATRTHRTIEAELVDAVATLPDEPDELPADMAEAIAALHLLGDDELWRAARQRLAPEKSSEIEELHRKRKRDGLSVSELEALATLMKEYTRIMLVRSRSAALLKQRGHVDPANRVVADSLEVRTPRVCCRLTFGTGPDSVVNRDRVNP